MKGNMNGKVCLVTGANSGIGKETALGLARMGARVVMVCRNRLRGTVAQTEIMGQTGNNRVDLLIADISSQDQVHRLTNQLLSRYDRLDVLINNAGISIDKPLKSVDGVELTFATNYLSHFLLTDLLLDTLKASAPSRIINVSSFVHRWTNRIDFDDLEKAENFSPILAYAQSKLAMLMFTYELASRLKGSGVTVNALNPGLVNTNLGHDFTGYLKVMGSVMKSVAIPPEAGARTTIYLASSPKVKEVSGKYFYKQKPKLSTKVSYDREIWKRLWEVSTQLTEKPVKIPQERRLKKVAV